MGPEPSFKHLPPWQLPRMSIQYNKNTRSGCWQKLRNPRVADAKASLEAVRALLSSQCDAEAPRTAQVMSSHFECFGIIFRCGRVPWVKHLAAHYVGILHEAAMPRYFSCCYWWMLPLLTILGMSVHVATRCVTLLQLRLPSSRACSWGFGLSTFRTVRQLRQPFKA